MENRKNYNNAIIASGNNAIADGSVWVQGGKNNSLVGCAFECLVKQECIGNRFKGISKGKTDVNFCGRRHEIKTNCGGYENIAKADYVIYAIIDKTDRLDSDFVLNFSNVIPSQDFIEFLESDSRNTKMNGNRKMIQNIKANKSLRARFEEFIWNYPSLQEYLEELKEEGLR